MRRASWRVIRSAVSSLRPRTPSVRYSGAFSSLRDAGAGHVGVEILLEQMVRRHLALLATFSDSRTHQRLPCEY
jgi:hypothetical protein